MTEPKYYTPELSEFHVGFEYEIRNFCDIDFTKAQMNACQDLAYISDILGKRVDGAIRVKILCREVIEECGWDATLDDIGYGINQSGCDDGWNLRPCIGTTLCLINRIKVLNGKRHEHQIFQGKILNKSELKFQMKRLNIKP